MAKVEGPLMSLGARGKIGNAIVFFPWKGVNAVRRWVIPTNPETAGQGDSRLILGAIGRATRTVVLTSDYVEEIKDYMAAGQTWVSSIVSKVVGEILPDNTDFDTLHAVYSGHTAKNDWDDAASAVGLTDLDIAYKGATNKADAGFQLLLLALYATQEHAGDPSRFDRAPYTTALASWTDSEIESFCNDELGHSIDITT